MRIVIQRVTSAQVSVAGSVVAGIGKGLCVYAAVCKDDTEADADYACKRIVDTKLFDAEDGKGWAKSVREVEGEVLVVSNFTLAGSVHKGTKPNFTGAMKPDLAREVFELFVKKLATSYPKITVGSFGEYMMVSSVNDGPVTIFAESPSK